MRWLLCDGSHCKVKPGDQKQWDQQSGDDQKNGRYGPMAEPLFKIKDRNGDLQKSDNIKNP